MSLKPIAVLLASCLTGCVSLSSPPVAVAPGNSTLVIQPRIVTGGYNTQSAVINNTVTSINHLTIKLFKVVSGVATDLSISKDVASTSFTVSGGNLTNTFTFGNLASNVTYRAKAFAYGTSGTTNLINLDDANSWDDVVISTNNSVTFGQLQVKLIDVAFSGTGTSTGLTVTNGGWTTTGSESIN